MRVRKHIEVKSQSSARRCLASLAAGSRQPDEVFVVDNGSAQMPQDVCDAAGVVYQGFIPESSIAICAVANA